MNTSVTLLIVTYTVLAIILVFLAIHFIRKKSKDKYAKKIKELELEKNLIASTPIITELNKVEDVIKTEKMEEKYKYWQEKFEIVKKDNLSRITDMIIDLDVLSDSNNKKEKIVKVAKTEIEIYKAKTVTDNILNEIKEITVSEEKYRGIVTKLKNKYRILDKKFKDNPEIYEEIKDTIVLQFDNIEKRFLSFEKAMSENEYGEAVHLVKALDTLIEHMSIVIEEVPDLVLLANHLIPKRIQEIKDINNDLLDKGYPLGYLNIDYNIEESVKNTRVIMDRVKILNLEDCMFELKTILNYLDSLFNEFDKEKIARKDYEELSKSFGKRLKKINKVISDIYKQLEDIKNMYHLNDKDLLTIDDVNKKLMGLNKEYKNIIDDLKHSKKPYSECSDLVNNLAIRLKKIEEELDQSLKSLGSMYDDEVRAREQLEEIQELLKQCKVSIRSYKLPIITNNYFVELSEANDAIGEIIKELEKKPITIKTLNTRVDTARDLVLKLYNTTNDMIRSANLAEIAIVYGNRYRSSLDEIDKGLNNSQVLFYKGKYQQAFELALHIISFVDVDIEKKVMGIYKGN